MRGLQAVKRSFVWRHHFLSRHQRNKFKHQDDAITAAPTPTPSGLKGSSPVADSFQETTHVHGEADRRERKPWRPHGSAPRSSHTPTVHFRRAFTVCKDLDYADGNEDFFIWADDRGGAAIFDGATESFAARRWVRMIAAAWEANPQLDFKQLQSQYEDEIDSLNLGWAQAQARQRGSFTTIASVTPARGGLSATLIGDSCIALCKNNAVLEMLPSSDPSFFGSTPEALASTPNLLTVNTELMNACSWVIPLEPGDIDCVVLMTDAIGHWVTSEPESSDESRIESVLACRDEDQWSALVQRERASGRMKVDDSTVVVLYVGSES